jgi:hypothetical protein
MATIKNLINQVLFEKNEQTLKIFYKIDVTVFPDTPEEEEKPVENQTQPQEQQPQAVPAQAPAAPQGLGPAPAFSKKVESALKEDEQNGKEQEPERFRNTGYISLEKEEAENIQTIEDMAEYLSGKEITDNSGKGKKVINEFIKEAIVLISQGAPINELITKKDKFIVEIDYGFEKEDSIGFKINKLSGVGSMSISMKRDDDIVPGPFNVTSFNERILFLRNQLNNPSMGED